MGRGHLCLGSSSKPTIVQHSITAARAGELVACPIITLELLHDAKDRDDVERVSAAFAALRQAPVTGSVTDAAIGAVRELAGAGADGNHRVPTADALIAAAAAERGFGVLHYDHDFDRLATVLPSSASGSPPPAAWPDRATRVTHEALTRTTDVLMPPPRADRALLRDARRGDRTAFAALIERHYPVLLAGCRRLLGDADLARDAAHEAVLRAMLGLDHLRNDDRFGAWLVGIGLNVCRSLFGARRRQTSSLEALLDERRLAEPPAAGRGPADHAEAADLAARVREAIAELPVGQREAVALFYLGGLTHAEIADELGTQPGAIKTRLHKARRVLRASLLEYSKEHTAMTDQPADLIPMHIAELRRTAAVDPTAVRHILFLEDDDRDRRLPIWIGAAEATALAVILDNVQLPRPGVYQFAAALLAAADAQLREVRITELTNHTFYAQAILADGTSVDARPSDALTLALVTGAPIRVAPGVLEQAAKHEEALSDLLDEARRAPDDAHTIAEELRTRITAQAAELTSREERTRREGSRS